MYYSVKCTNLQILAESEEAQMCILRNVWELWQRHPQMVCVLVDKMLKTQIVDCSAVATWLFSKEMAPYFTHGYLWELLHLTVDKMNKHVSKLNAEDADSGLQRRGHLALLQGDGALLPVGAAVPHRRPDEQARAELQEAREALARADSSSSDSEDETNNKKKKDQNKPTEEHLVRCDTDAREYETHWYNATVGRLRQVFLCVSITTLHHDPVGAPRAVRH
ncbi:Nuclear cap-binding protein subunit 1 [Operophtera brumata]|uniref:Nuclear cap-binding protein subunit 1 n=1 Tax=Operophtera brumata TaxID=104452 RepID=A0A0L7LUP8_OPEBR|nr:Nuclear cap-binding protein subunit 1 [Operophtera brumata]